MKLYALMSTGALVTRVCSNILGFWSFVVPGFGCGKGEGGNGVKRLIQSPEVWRSRYDENPSWLLLFEWLGFVFNSPLLSIFLGLTVSEQVCWRVPNQKMIVAQVWDPKRTTGFVSYAVKWVCWHSPNELLSEIDQERPSLNKLRVFVWLHQMNFRVVFQKKRRRKGIDAFGLMIWFQRRKSRVTKIDSRRSLFPQDKQSIYISRTQSLSIFPNCSDLSFSFPLVKFLSLVDVSCEGRWWRFLMTAFKDPVLWCASRCAEKPFRAQKSTQSNPVKAMIRKKI